MATYVRSCNGQQRVSEEADKEDIINPTSHSFLHHVVYRCLWSWTHLVPRWKSVLKADPLDWLLEKKNPSPRYFTLRDILDYPEDSVEIVSTKESIRNYGKVAKIFSKQRPEGYWEAAEQPYHPKYKSTYWQVMILSQLGLDRSDRRVRKACEHIFQFQLEEGGFSTFRKEGAKNEYRWVKEKTLKRGKEPPPFETWCKDKIRENEMSYLTGNVAASLIKLGYTKDERVRRALKWLVDIQNADGGWLCPYWKAHIKDKHGCFMGTITPLDAFSEVPTELKTTEMRTAIERGVEFLLMHRLFKADHHGFKIIKESWLKLGFPWFFYDILRGLSVVTKLGYTHDERLNDALEILAQKQNAEGKWILEDTPSGRMQTNLEQKGKPSKWITLHALRVLKRIYQNSAHGLQSDI